MLNNNNLSFKKEHSTCSSHLILNKKKIKLIIYFQAIFLFCGHMILVKISTCKKLKSLATLSSYHSIYQSILNNTIFLLLLNYQECPPIHIALAVKYTVLEQSLLPTKFHSLILLKTYA